jgi:hypothetical protein
MANTFNIATFIAQVNQRGTHRTNKFFVRMTMPPGLQALGLLTSFATITNTLQFWVEAAHIPGIMLQQRQILRWGYGAQEKKPFAPTFNDVNFTILSDGKAENWTFFKGWINYIINFDRNSGLQRLNPETGAQLPDTQAFYEISYKSEYATTVEIICFDAQGLETYKITLREAFPIFVGDIPLNWGDNNQLMRIPVTFTFSDWYATNVISVV